MKATRSTLGVALTTMLLAACSNTAGVTAPSFEFRVTGDVTVTVGGAGATFGERNDNGFTSWSLDLQQGTGPTLDGVSFLTIDGRLPVGTHQLIDVPLPTLIHAGEIAAFVSLRVTDARPGFLGGAVSGSITISESSADELRGTFSFTADGNVFPQASGAVSGTVTVTGEFAAVPGPPGG